MKASFKHAIKKVPISIAFVICMGLTYYSFRYTNVFSTIFRAHAIEHKDNILVHLLFTLLFFAIIKFFMMIFADKKNEERNCRILLIIVMGATFILSLLWINAAHCIPTSDQKMILQVASHFHDKNYSDLADSAYIGMIRYQIRLAEIFLLLSKIFGSFDYHFFQYFNACMVPLIVLCGYGILKECFENVKVRIVYCLFMITCFPIMLYTTFVYGELLSIMLSMLLIWMSILILTRKRLLLLVPAVISAILGIWSKGTVWITVIAVTIILVLYALKRKDILLLLCAAAILLGPILANHILDDYYRHVSGYELNQGIPFTASIAMGLQGDPENPGWFNSYTYHIYGHEGCNQKKTNQAAIQNIEDSLKKFETNPDEMAAFFHNKLLLQWNAPDYEYMAMNSYYDSPPPAWILSFFGGKLFDHAEFFLNEYQWLVYLGDVLGIVFLFLKREKYFFNILILNLIGGFLFTAVWETKARYILSYIVIMVMISSYGWMQSVDFLSKKYEKGYSIKGKK